MLPSLNPSSSSTLVNANYLRVTEQGLQKSSAAFMSSLAEGRPVDHRAANAPPNKLESTEARLLTRDLPPVQRRQFVSSAARGHQSKEDHESGSGTSGAGGSAELDEHSQLSIQYHAATEGAVAAKRRLTRLQKTLQRSQSATAVRRVREHRKAGATAVREAMEERTGSRVMRELEKTVTPASEEEVITMGMQILEAFSHVEMNPDARGWFKLYKVMDRDDDGRISLDEFERLVRTYLRLGVAKVPDKRLHEVWLAVDLNRSGTWNTKEFGKMMLPAERRLEQTRQGGGAASGPASCSASPEASTATGRTPLPSVRKKGRGAESMETRLARESAMIATRAALDEVDGRRLRMEREAARLEKKLEGAGIKLPLEGASVKLATSKSLPALPAVGRAPGARAVSIEAEWEGVDAPVLPPIS